MAVSDFDGVTKEGGYIGVAHSASGANLYAIIRNSKGKAWRVSIGEYETYATANLGDYDFPLTEQGTASRWYAFEFPQSSALFFDYPLPEGASAPKCKYFWIDIYVRAGAAPAEGDAHVKGLGVWMECPSSAVVIMHRPYAYTWEGAWLADGAIQSTVFEDGAITGDAHDKTTSFPIESRDRGASRIQRRTGNLMQAAKMEGR